VRIVALLESAAERAGKQGRDRAFAQPGNTHHHDSGRLCQIAREARGWNALGSMIVGAMRQSRTIRWASPGETMLFLAKPDIARMLQSWWKNPSPLIDSSPRRHFSAAWRIAPLRGQSSSGKALRLLEKSRTAEA
jgi:hypothetical protein